VEKCLRERAKSAEEVSISRFFDEKISFWPKNIIKWIPHPQIIKRFINIKRKQFATDFVKIQILRF
jgi:hypothetical protein